MARVALLTMSNGRDSVARELTGFCRKAEDAAALPHFTMLASSATSAPLLLLGSIDPHALARPDREGKHPG
jgi:hypothetical protein